MARLRLIVASACLLGLVQGVRAAPLFPKDAFSDGAAGTTAAAFLKIPAGARAQGLGGSHVAAAADSEAMFWNPAGLARLEKAGLSDASFGYGALLETSYAGTMAYARPLSADRGAFGVSLTYFSQSSIQGYGVRGDPEASFTPKDYALSGAYGRKLGRVLLGGGLKVIRSELADVSGTGFAADFGVQSERVTDVGEGALDLGASILNFGPPLKMGSSSDPLPCILRGGSLWHISPTVNALLDGNFPVDGDPFVGFGLEADLPVQESFKASFRGGYNTRNASDIEGLAGMSLGFGVTVYRFRLDYAWVPMGDLGSTHRVTMGLKF